MTRAQSNTIIAVKELCDVYPDGITLKKLAETTGVTPAAASVMVDLLVTKKIIKSTRSKNDRRAILVRLTPETTRLFEIVDRSLGEAVMSVADALGPQILHDWLKILAAASLVLRQTAGGRISAGFAAKSDAESRADSPFDGNEAHPRGAVACGQYDDQEAEQA